LRHFTVTFTGALVQHIETRVRRAPPIASHHQSNVFAGFTERSPGGGFAVRFDGRLAKITTPGPRNLAGVTVRGGVLGHGCPTTRFMSSDAETNIVMFEENSSSKRAD